MKYFGNYNISSVALAKTMLAFRINNITFHKCAFSLLHEFDQCNDYVYLEFCIASLNLDTIQIDAGKILPFRINPCRLCYPLIKK